MGFLFDEKMHIEADKAFYIYLGTKIFVSLALVFMVIYTGFFKKDSTNSIIQFVATIILQFLPLLVRSLLDGNEPKILIATITIFLVILIYLALVLTLDLLSDKTSRDNPTLQGKTRKVVDEDNYYDENGKFVGVSKK
jgi:hypothetical protein